MCFVAHSYGTIQSNKFHYYIVHSLYIFILYTRVRELRQ